MKLLTTPSYYATKYDDAEEENKKPVLIRADDGLLSLLIFSEYSYAYVCVTYALQETRFNFVSNVKGGVLLTLTTNVDVGRARVPHKKNYS